MRVLREFRQLTCCASALGLLLIAAPLFAQVNVTAIEEDWQLIIDTPNAGRSSPQLNCLMSTTGNTLSDSAVLHINP